MKGGRDIPSLVRAELRQVTREMEVLRVVLSRTDTGVPQNHAIARAAPPPPAPLGERAAR